MPRLADAEQLEVDAAGGANRFLVCRAGLGDPLARRGAVGDVHVLLRDVQMREEVLPHVAVIAVRALGRHRVVLVEIEREDPRKIDIARLVAANQLFVDAEGGAAGREPEDDPAFGSRLAVNDLDDPLGHERGQVLMLVENDGAKALTIASAFDGWDGARRGVSLRRQTFTSMAAPRL